MKGNHSKADFIINYICDMDGLYVHNLRGKSRSRELVMGRKYFCYFSRKYTKLHLREIGNMINRDHATVIHAINDLTNLAVYDKEVAYKIMDFDIVFKEQLENTSLEASNISTIIIKNRLTELKKEIKQLESML